MMDLGSGEAALCGADSVERVKNVSRALEFTSLGRPRAASGGASCSGAALQRRRCAGERARVSGTRSELQTRLAAPGLAARRGAAGGNQPEDASPESAGSSCTSTPCAKFTRVLSEPLDPRLQSQRSDVLPPADEAHRCFTVAALPTWRPR
ncbi:unnamed protein product [Prorocentrum cordatum]|uniref:Uncharacterized protein n=1 Tax=Prorocentrum cordatum TaxID=2364126 RepID=A0ABN9TVK4_9DINO|nr:unnamed protein product [Polarella glacialis]